MSNSTSTVVLHVYDLSKGMMAAMSRQFLGQHFEGIWYARDQSLSLALSLSRSCLSVTHPHSLRHTGIVVYGNEYYYGQGIFSDPPVRRRTH